MRHSTPVGRYSLPLVPFQSDGRFLSSYFLGAQPRARYKQSLDPTVEDVKKLCDSLRRGAKDERVLFHYNGHGVPRPTSNSEMWVFNKNFTQYIPLSVYDLQVFSPPLGSQPNRMRSPVVCYAGFRAMGGPRRNCAGRREKAAA